MKKKEPINYKLYQMIRRWHHVRNYQRDYSRKRNYGLTPQDYEDLLVEQNGRCAVCNKFMDEDVRIAVDHDHRTEQVRGLVCTFCNIGLGYVDRRLWLASALSYLAKKRPLGS